MSTCVNVTGGVGVRRHLMMVMMMIGVGLCLVQPSAAAAALPRTPPTILCSVTAEAGDTFRYQLSRPLDAPPGCVQGWEDENRTVIVNNKGFDKKLVQSRTNRSIVTTSCRDYLHYTEDCSGKWNESHCRVDCKTLSEQPAATSPPVAPPETWCRDRMTCGLGIGFGILGVVIVLGLIIWCIYSVWMKRMD